MYTRLIIGLILTLIVVSFFALSWLKTQRVQPPAFPPAKHIAYGAFTRVYVYDTHAIAQFVHAPSLYVQGRTVSEAVSLLLETYPAEAEIFGKGI